MATFNQSYDLLVSVDVGYNASKVYVNGITFEIPSDIVDITGNDTYIGGIRKPGYIASTYVEGAKHLIGEQARMLMSEPEYKDRMGHMETVLNSYDKFTTQDSESHLLTTIAVALIKYSEYTKENHIQPEFDVTTPVTKDSQWKIWVILGFPHDKYESIFKAIRKSIVGRHAFTVERDIDTYDLDFELLPSRVFPYSQALAVFMGLISNDNGEILDDSPYLEKLPCVVVDGGQKTMGIYKITSNNQIEMAESNTKFAMNNVFERVVERIHKEYGRTDISVSNINDILKQGGNLVYIKSGSDQTDSVDINEIEKEEKEKVCNELIDYLNEKFSQFLDIKSFEIAGGTGSAFFPQIKEYIDTHKAHLKDTTELVQYKYLGKQIEPQYAIAVGLYKVLRHIVNLKSQKNGNEGANK